MIGDLNGFSSCWQWTVADVNIASDGPRSDNSSVHGSVWAP